MNVLNMQASASFLSMCARLKKCEILSLLEALFVCLCAYMCIFGEECASRCLILYNFLACAFHIVYLLFVMCMQIYVYVHVVCV